MKIYTKTGDNGTTSLLQGKRISKSSLRIEAIGSIDELNANFGLFVSLNSKQNTNLNPLFERVQSELFTISANLAKFEKRNNLESSIAQLESEIDKFQEEIPELKNFILPGGSQIASYIHICRAICRRVERNLVKLHEKDQIGPEILKYINRLSDWLFVIARVVNKRQGIVEKIWKN